MIQQGYFLHNQMMLLLKTYHIHIYDQHFLHQE